MACTKWTKNLKAHVAVWPDYSKPSKQGTKAGLPEFVCPSGNARTCGNRCPGRKAAKKYADAQEQAIKDGSYLDPNDPTTVAQFARRYAELKTKHRKGTVTRLDSILRNHVEPTALGRMRLASVRREHWDIWEAQRFAAVKSSAYARRIIRDMRSIFALAVDYDKISKSPAPRRISQGAAKAERRTRTYTRAEVEALIIAMGELRPECRDMMIVQAGLGLRIGELIALRASDVNRFAKTVRIEYQITGNGNRERVEPKTDGSKSTIRVPGDVIDTLVEHMANYPTGIDGSIFTNPNAGGRAWTQESYRRAFKRALRRAGLDETWRTHDLRHFCGSIRLAEGFTVPEVAQLLRETEDTVVKTYAHVIRDNGLGEKLDGAWCGGAEAHGSAMGRTGS